LSLSLIVISGRALSTGFCFYNELLPIRICLPLEGCNFLVLEMSIAALDFRIFAHRQPRRFMGYSVPGSVDDYPQSLICLFPFRDTVPRVLKSQPIFQNILILFTENRGNPRDMNSFSLRQFDRGNPRDMNSFSLRQFE